MRSKSSRTLKALSCLCAAVAPVVGGCISTNTPGDLSLVSVEAVDVHDQPELPGPGVSPLLGMVSDRDLIASGQTTTGGEKPHRLMLKIEFTSATDLSEFVIDNSYNLGSETFLCSRQSVSPPMGYPFVFWNGIRLGTHEPDPIKSTDTGKAERTVFKYYIFAHIALPKIVPSKPPQEGFDLRKRPAELCFYLRGGNEFGRGYRSNTVVVPKNLVATALQKAPLGSGE